MIVRKVQLEYCYESKLFAPSDDILTLQRYGLISNLPNISLIILRNVSTLPCFVCKIVRLIFLPTSYILHLPSSILHQNGSVALLTVSFFQIFIQLLCFCSDAFPSLFEGVWIIPGLFKVTYWSL